jgi:hypothetical protein
MNRRLFAVIAVAFAIATAASGQGFNTGNLQIHGFATQSFVRSNGNNYLGMDSSARSTDWTEAAINVNDQVSDKLRVGAQFHLTRLGAFGGDLPSVDWALGDYSFKQWLGVRAGKVKIKWGLYNDTQDADPNYLWSLLPESVYGIDIRATNLSQYGVELYGRVPLGEGMGNLDYSAYYGDYFFSTSDGSMATFSQQGLTFANPPGGKTPGFDLRWATPLKGLKIGGSLMKYDATGNLINGTYVQPPAFWPTYYAEYHHKRLFAAWQYVKLVQYQTVTLTGTAPSTSGADSRAWFAMAGYHLTDKLQLGTYYTRYLMASAGDPTNPANYFHDAVVSGRYDINPNFYAKVEGHFIDGNALGFYTLDNPNGFMPRTNLLVAKLGFSF